MQPAAGGRQPTRTRSARTFGTTAAALLVVAAGAFAYFNSLNGPFFFDDKPAIVRNPSLRSLWPPHRALIAPPDNPFAGRPVVNLSFAINRALFGGDVRGYHATNIAIHILTALALFGVLRRTFRLPRLRDRFAARADALALAATLLWEVHPLLTEAVTYTSTRTEGLMALFMMLTLYCAIRGFEAAHGARRWRVAAVIACAIGMGCKEVMAAAPLLVYLYDAVLVSDSFREPLRRRRWFYLALAGTWLIIPALMIGFVSFTAKTGEGFIHTTPWTYALTQAGVIVHYLRLSFWPHPLTIDYIDWPLARGVRDVLPQAILVVTLVALSAYGIVRRRPAALLGAWFFVILAPTSSFVPLRSEVVAERRMYLPLMAIVVGVLLAADAVIRDRRGARKPAGAAVAALVLVMSLATIWRNGDYASELLIWSDAAAKRPNSPRTLHTLAEQLRVAGRWQESRHAYERVVRLAPREPTYRVTLANLLIGEGDLDRAAGHAAAALELSERHGAAHTAMGLIHARRGQADAAIARYRRALELDPTSADAHLYLGDALAERGEPTAALRHYEAALRAMPDDVETRRKVEQLRGGGGGGGGGGGDGSGGGASGAGGR